MPKMEKEPVQDAVKAYLELAYGLTEASKKKAEKTVKKLTGELLGKGSATAGQLQSMAEDVISMGLSNREALVRLVRAELDRALGRVWLATSEEVATLTARIHELERELHEVKGAGAGQVKPAVRATEVEPARAALATAKKTPAKTTVAKKTVAKKAPAKAPAAQSAAVHAEPAPAAATVAKKTAAKKTAAKKTAAKKTAAKKTAAKKTATETAATRQVGE